MPKTENLYIVNFGEHEPILYALRELEKKNTIKIKKILDYDEYFSILKNFFNINIISFYSHIRLRNLDSLNTLNYLNDDLIAFTDIYIDSAIDILQTRHSKNCKDFSYQESKLLFYSSLNRSINELRSASIDVVFFNHIPHHFNTYVLYIAAKFLKIKTLILTKLSFNGFRYYFQDSINYRSWSIVKGLQFTQNADINDLKEYEYLRDRALYSSPNYMSIKYNKSVSNFLAFYFQKFNIFFVLVSLYGALKYGFFKRIPNHFKWDREGSFSEEQFPFKFQQSMHQIQSIFKIDKLSKVYKKHCKFPDIKKKYVLFAPNYQPEATTLPVAGRYSDVILCVKLLRSALSDDVHIYYKEHADVFNLTLESFRARSEGFYNELSKIDKLSICPMEASQIQLIDNSLFVAIQTSNIGLESIIRGKNILTFGPLWYEKLGRVYKWDLIKEKKRIDIFLKNPSYINFKLLNELNKYTFRLDNIMNNDDHSDLLRLREFLCLNLKSL